MEDEYDTHISGKLILLSEILKLSESIGDKVLVLFGWHSDIGSGR